MPRPNDQDPAACQAGCSGCGPDGMQLPPDAPTGGRMALMSAVFFLNPLIMAIVGAAVLPLAWGHEASQLLGGLAGLALGVCESVAVVKWIHAAGRKRNA